MINRVLSIRLGANLGIIQVRSFSTMMNRGFLRGETMPRLWITTSRSGPQTGLIKYNRRVFSEGSPKEAEKVARHVNQQPTWLQKFFSLKEMPEKYTFQWYREMVLICTVFAVTGSSTMFLVSMRHCIHSCLHSHARTHPRNTLIRG